MALGSRPARSTRRRGRPWLFLAVLATFLVLLVNAALSARSPTPVREQAEQSYLDEALPAIQQSTQEGLDLAAVRTQAAGLSPGTVVSQLNGVVSQSEQTFATVQKLNPPTALRTAHDLLVAALDLRVLGARAFVQAIGTVRSAQPAAVGVQALISAGLDFQAADRAYSLFQQAMPSVNPPLPASQWVPDDSVFSDATLSVFVATLRSAGSLTPIQDVSVVAVTTNPQPVNVQNGVEMMPVAKNLDLQIVVADIGNQAEKNLTVTATIVPALFGPMQSVRNFVNLTPGQSVTVDLGGLRVLAGQATTLTASIQMPTGDTDVAGASKIITFEMTK